MTGKFCSHLASSTPNEGFFYMPQICDMGPTALLPLRLKDAEHFFALKNPTASAGFFPLIVSLFIYILHLQDTVLLDSLVT
jgi:hypothetical protein